MGNAVGMVCGRIGEETPKYTLIKTADTFQIRRYQPSIIAETTYATTEMGKNTSDAFRRLANFIGVFSDAQNRTHTGRSEKVAMTAPVLMAPSGSGASAATGGGAETLETSMLGGAAQSRDLIPSGQGTMSFLLPSKYTSVETAPTPTDSRVVLRLLPERIVAVRTFTWGLSEDNIRTNLQALVSDLAHDREWQGDTTGHAASGAEWCVAGYNAPFCLPWARTNEVMVNVSPTKGAEVESAGASGSKGEGGQHAVSPPRL